MAERVTRGRGLLEGFLARRRAAMARRLLTDVPRSGRILDVGCGSSPLFLRTCGFRERHGVDQLVAPEGDHVAGIRLHHYTAAAEVGMPFEDDYFDAVTMLAVFEHIPPHLLTPLLRDVRRVLHPGAPLVLTTPASWTDPILRALARLRLVSSQEIEEHQDAYDHDRIREHLLEAGFHSADLRFGSFELGMNLWVSAHA